MKMETSPQLEGRFLMSTLARSTHGTHTHDAPPVGGILLDDSFETRRSQAAEAAETRRVRAAGRALGVLRIAFGLTFLWAFADKLFGLGYSTKSSESWLNGGNPTAGFLKFGAKGPFKSFYNSIGGAPWVNILFMAALLALGVALTLGIGMRLAGIGGTILYLMMWTVAMPPTTNPVIDDHILGAISIAVLSLTLAGNTWGLGHRWAKTPMARRFPILR